MPVEGINEHAVGSVRGSGDGASHQHRGHQLHLYPDYSSPVLRMEQVECTISKACARMGCSVLDAPSSNSW